MNATPAMPPIHPGEVLLQEYGPVVWSADACHLAGGEACLAQVKLGAVGPWCRDAGRSTDPLAVVWIIPA